MQIPALLPYMGAGVVLGVIAHRAILIHGEWHVRAPEILAFHTAPFVVLLAMRNLSHAMDNIVFIDRLLCTMCCYVPALFASILTYRLFFHKLTKAGFPGPWYLRISKLCHVWQVRTSKNYLILEDLRQKYGDFVRTGKS
jgi:hypothetical protein